MQSVGVQERVRAMREGRASSRRAGGGSERNGRGRGLVWPLLERLGVLCGVRSEAQLAVLETISLGGRRQLFLIACGGERYLVGAGAEGVGSMLRVGPLGAVDTAVGEESA